MSGTVFIVDDDPAVRDSLTSLFVAAGYVAESYPDADTFLAGYDPDRPGCLVLDMQMPGMGGLGLQEELDKRKDRRPIIFLTAHGTVPMTARAFRNGAFDFIEKPAEGSSLLALIRKAIERDAENRREEVERDLARQRCDSLTEREREILLLVIAGNSSKDIARQLDISYRTVELHRTRIMHKTNARNVIELAALAQATGLSLNPPHSDNTPPDTR